MADNAVDGGEKRMEAQMVHENLNIDEWKLRYPETQVTHAPKESESLPEVIGPLDLLRFETQREAEHKNGAWYKRLFTRSRRSTDVMLLNLGEPARRDVTKIGGVPYWPASRRWPDNSDGVPMTFVAQFCFADSKDIVSQLPGEVLLIFAAGEFGKDWFPGDTEKVRFEWLMLGHTDLIKPENQPASKWPITPCYASRCRFADRSAWLAVSATKIGGFPAWKQGEIATEARFLCQLGSVFPSYSMPYPFVNHPEPIGRSDDERWDRLLKWFDLGALYFFIDRRRQIEWYMQC